MAYRRISLLLLVSLLAAGSIHAATELGEPRVGSYRGQALVADIELASLDDPATPPQVRAASPDVYRGASLAVPAVLSSLQLNVLKQGGKYVVHVTSGKPVDTDMLLLFLELGQGGNRDVRLATLMLAADPHPAPVVTQAPVPVAASAPAPAPAIVPVAAPAAPAAARPAPPWRPIAAVAAPLHVGAVSTALPASVRPAPAVSCKASAVHDACAVLDTKNLALQARLAGLEDKIKLLQANLAPAAVTPAATVSAPAAPIASIAPPAKPLAVLVKPKKPKPPAPAPATTPWLWIGVAAAVGLAALGAIVFLLLRRRGRAAPVAPAGPKPPGLMAGVRNRLMPAKVAPTGGQA